MYTILSYLYISKGYQTILAYALVISIISYLYFKKIFSYWKDRNVEYVVPVPFFGNLLDIFLLRRNLGEQMAKIYRQSDAPLVGIFMLNRPALILRDPDLIKTILIKNFDSFRNRSVSHGIDESKTPNGTSGMLVSKDDTWKWLRKTVTPAFSVSKLKTSAEDVRNRAEKMADYVRSAIGTEAGVNMRDVCSRYVIEAGCSAFFGIEAECYERRTSPYMAANSNLFDYRVFSRGVHIAMAFISPTISKMLSLEFFHGASSRFVVGSVEEALNERETKCDRKNDYLDLLRDAMKKYDGEGNLLSNSVEIFVANNETLSTVLTFSCYELVKNREIQEKLREEIFQTQSDNDQTLCEQIQHMRYLECFMKEVIRMYPTVPFLDRICNRDFQLDDPPMKIEKGTCVYVPVFGIHSDPKYYKNPHTFYPERFLEDTTDWSVYLPFGKGPRMCPAKKYSELVIKCFLICLLTNFELKESDRTPEKMTFNTRGFTLQPSGNIFVNILPLSTRRIKGELV